MKKTIYYLIFLTGVFYGSFKIPSLVWSQEQSSTPTPVNQDEIREKVKEKVENLRKNPKAYMGTLTDKTQDSLQLKDLNGEIQLISVDPANVTFAKVAKTTTKISYDDIGIGDFVVALGINNGNSVLTAKRVLVTEPLTDPKRTIILGKIISLGKKDAVIRQADLKEVTLSFPKRWTGPDIDELNENDTVIAIGDEDGNTITVRTIELANEPAVSPTP